MIILATPLGKEGRLHIETALFCNMTDKRSDVIWAHIKTFSPEMSRNNLIEDSFYNKPNLTHIMFVDSDVVPPLYGLSKLLELDTDIAVGMCPVYLTEGLFWNVSDENNNLIPYHKDIPLFPFEVQDAGAGCLLIKKEVLENIGWPYFKMEYQPKYENKGSAIKTGEDIYFCKKAKEAGYKIMAHPLVKCKHYNEIDLEEMFRVMKKQIETKSVKPVKA